MKTITPFELQLLIDKGNVELIDARAMDRAWFAVSLLITGRGGNGTKSNAILVTFIPPSDHRRMSEAWSTMQLIDATPDRDDRSLSAL